MANLSGGTMVPQQNATASTSPDLHFSRFPGIGLHFMNGNEAGNMTGESTRDDLAITPPWSLCTFYTGSHSCDVKISEMDEPSRPD